MRVVEKGKSKKQKAEMPSKFPSLSGLLCFDAKESQKGSEMCPAVPSRRNQIFKKERKKTQRRKGNDL